EIVRGEVVARANHGHLVVPGELAAMTAKQVDLGRVPEGLGVKQQAVNVEDDGPIPPAERHAQDRAKNELPDSDNERRSGIARYRPSGTAAWSASSVWTTDVRPIRSPHASGPSGQFVPSRIAVSTASGVATPSAIAEAASLTIAARIRASIWAGSSFGGCGPSARRLSPDHGAPRSPSVE